MPTATDVLMGRPAQLPYDIQTEQAPLSRRRALLRSLQEAALRGGPPTIQAGDRTVPNWGDAISQVAQAYLGSKREKELDAEEAKVASDMQQRLAVGLENYVKTKYGAPAVNQPSTNLEDAGPGEGNAVVRPAVQGNPTLAAAQAVASGVPDLKTLGMSDIASLNKNQMTTKDWLSLTGFDPMSQVRAGQANDPTLLQPKPGQVVVGNRVYPTAGGVTPPGAQPTVDAREQFGPVGPIPGAPNVVGQIEQGTGKAHFAPAGTQVNVDTKGASEFAKKTAEDWSKTLSEGRANLVGGMAQLPNLEMAMKLINTAQTGITSDWVLAAQRIAKDVGLSADEAGKITDSQSLQALLGKYVLEDVKKLGAGVSISNADRDWAEKMNLATLKSDPRAMQQMMRVRVATMLNSAEQHERNIAGATEAFPEESRRIGSYRVATDFGDLPQRLGLMKDSTGRWSATGAMPPGSSLPPQVAPTPTAAPTPMRRKSDIDPLLDKYAPRR